MGLELEGGERKPVPCMGPETEILGIHIWEATSLLLQLGSHQSAGASSDLGQRGIPSTVASSPLGAEDMESREGADPSALTHEQDTLKSKKASAPAQRVKHSPCSVLPTAPNIQISGNTTTACQVT